MKEKLIEAKDKVQAGFHHLADDFHNEVTCKFKTKGELVRKNAKYKKDVNYDKVMKKLNKKAKAIFEVVDCGGGDESMAVLPWKGAIKEPTHHPPINRTKPAVTYEIDFVYGYKSDEIR